MRISFAVQIGHSPNQNQNFQLNVVKKLELTIFKLVKFQLQPL